MRISFLLCAASCCVAAPAAAAVPAEKAAPTATVAAKPDEATVAEAMRLLDAQSFEANMLRSTELAMGVSLAGMVDGLHKQFGDQVPADLIEQVKTSMHDHAMSTMKAHLPDIKRQVAEVYAQEFTRAELIHLRELQSDPVAIKARERSKVIEPKLMMIGVKTMQSAQPEVDADIKRIVGEYLAAHGKDPGGSS